MPCSGCARRRAAMKKMARKVIRRPKPAPKKAKETNV